MDEASQEIADDRWLAYELHDGLLQWLVSARMGVESAVHDLEPTPSPLLDRLRGTLTLLENSLEEGRELIGFLENRQMAEGTGLVRNLAAFVERIEPLAAEREQRITLQEPVQSWPGLSARVSWNVLRIAQQAIRNALSHAGPCMIRVACASLDSDSLQLTVRDDGRGFELEKVSGASQHYGLSSMRHRAQLIGGRLRIESQPGAGTQVTLSWPPA